MYRDYDDRGLGNPPQLDDGGMPDYVYERDNVSWCDGCQDLVREDVVMIGNEWFCPRCEIKVRAKIKAEENRHKIFIKGFIKGDTR